ncbi:tetratricopeptide repeat protein [Alkalinema sp. FACHB-956]|uniref:tetratricopeptide repeat protein n=1 Tax=Alkalinema sp. FACHB-956 TaxID=2692768 RepID=UPI0016854517|nr:tetratricopeptide repeat protein [Alkalinema sp. FACHB-956]MBD2325405.1 tetratricopeptide repeat protein [Alkalinema sp. FACHB-956]
MLTVPDAINAAFTAFQSGNWDRAEWMARQVIQIAPDHPAMLNLLGSVYYQRGELREAIVHYLAATEVQPNYAEAFRNLGVALQAIGQLPSALEALQQAVELAPEDATAHYNLGNLLVLLEQPEAALDAYHTAIALQPDFPQALTNLGTLLQSLGQLEAAIATFRQSLALTPNAVTAQINLANALQEKGNPESALGYYRRAAELQPFDPNLQFNLGNLHQSIGDFAAAKVHYLLALKLDSRHAPTHQNLALILQAEGQPNLAIAHLQQTLAYQPDNAAAYSNLGQLWQDQGELPSAITCFRTAIDLQPDFAQAHFQLSQALLAIGHLTEGFAEYEWRWQAPSYLQQQIPRHRKIPRWDGGAIAGKKILVWAEQDLGQTLICSRYLPQLVKQGAQVIVECDRAIVPLLANLPGLTQVIAKGDPVPDCALQIPLGSLPHAFSPSPTLLPPFPLLPSRPTPPNLLKPIGLIWSNRTADSPNAPGAFPLAQLLAALPPSQPWVSLQSHLTAEEQAQLEQAGIPPQTCTDRAELIQAIAALDGLLTIDCEAAHLAAALGKPVWLVLPTTGHWVWGNTKLTTPWYPTVQILRLDPQDGASWLDSIAATLQESPPKE